MLQFFLFIVINRQAHRTNQWTDALTAHTGPLRGLKFPEHFNFHTSACHRHHGLRVVGALQTEALYGGEHGDDQVGLVGRAGAVVGVELETRSTGAAEEAAGQRQAQLLTHRLVVTAAIRGACRVCGDRTEEFGLSSSKCYIQIQQVIHGHILSTIKHVQQVHP